MAPSLGERAGAALDGAAAKLTGAISTLKELMAPPTPRCAEALALACEVRAALARMSDADRQKAMAAAIGDGDEAIGPWRCFGEARCSPA